MNLFITSPRSGTQLMKYYLQRCGLNQESVDGIYNDDFVVCPNSLYHCHTSGLQKIKDFFRIHPSPRVLLLTRLDIFKQAISLYKSEYIKQFHIHYLEDRAPDPSLDAYNFQEIRKRLMALVQEFETCVSFLHTKKVEIYPLTYEDLTAPAYYLKRVIKDILAFFEVDSNIEINNIDINFSVELKKTTTEVDILCYRRFLMDMMTEKEC